MKIRRPAARFTYGWLAWLCATLGFEALAVYRNRRLGCKDTATAHIRSVAGIDPLRRDHLIWRGVIVGFCCWAAYHLAVAPARNPRPPR
jgi:hypothetical protein